MYTVTKLRSAFSTIVIVKRGLISSPRKMCAETFLVVITKAGGMLHPPLHKELANPKH